MPSCASPECGVFGRPFPACGRCKQRLYCGSHCLKTVQRRLFEIEDNINQLSGNNGVAISDNDETIEVCPPCFQTAQGAIRKCSSLDENDVDN